MKAEEIDTSRVVWVVVFCAMHSLFDEVRTGPDAPAKSSSCGYPPRALSAP